MKCRLNPRRVAGSEAHSESLSGDNPVPPRSMYLLSMGHDGNGAVCLRRRITGCACLRPSSLPDHGAG